MSKLTLAQQIMADYGRPMSSCPSLSQNRARTAVRCWRDEMRLSNAVVSQLSKLFRQSNSWVTLLEDAFTCYFDLLLHARSQPGCQEFVDDQVPLIIANMSEWRYVEFSEQNPYARMCLAVLDATRKLAVRLVEGGIPSTDLCLPQDWRQKACGILRRVAELDGASSMKYRVRDVERILEQEGIRTEFLAYCLRAIPLGHCGEAELAGWIDEWNQGLREAGINHEELLVSIQPVHLAVIRQLNHRMVSRVLATHSSWAEHAEIRQMQMSLRNNGL